MRVLVVGAGAVGGYFGYRMLKGGMDVEFMARGRTLARLLEQGLTVREDSGDETLRVKASERPSGSFDLVVAAVKSQDIPGIAVAIGPLVAHGGCILAVQNGLGSEEALARALPGVRILAGVVYIAADSPEPGVIVHTRELAKIIFGEVDGEPSEAARSVERELRNAGLDVRAEGDIAKRKWSKLAWNAGFNGVTALTGLGTGEAAMDPEASMLIATIMDEVAAVARAEGVDVAIDTSESLRWTAQFKGVRTSMLQDLQKRRPLELDAIYGEVSSRAALLGVPIPATQTVHRLLKALPQVAGVQPRPPQS